MKEPREFQCVIDRKKKSGDFKGLRLYLRRLLSMMPDDYYLLAELSSTCYQLGKHNESLTYANQAYQLAPDDYWVRYIYGCALLSKDRLDEAAEMFNSIIACDVNYLAYYEHGEGKRWAESLLNDSRYMRAAVYEQECYHLEARKMFLLHKSLRKRGLYSDFSMRQVNNHLRNLDVTIGDSDEDYSISKYSPQFYDSQSCYTRNEWTSISDIGKSFDDGVLTINEYLETERHYINTAIELALISGCSYLTVDYLEGKYMEQNVKEHPLNSHLLETAQKMRQGMKIRISDCAEYLQLCLRECGYASFSNHLHNFYIDFGYDFYMHIRTTLPKKRVEEVVLKNHLYFRP